MSKVDLFTGTEGKKRLAAALKAHDVIGNHAALARKVAEQAEVQEFSSGQTLLKQNATDQDVYLIIEGEVSIEINGKQVATSGPGAPIGEMAVLDPYGSRSASVLAITDIVVARVKRAVEELGKGISTSAGIAELSAWMQPADLHAAADAALYADKSASQRKRA